MSAALPSGAPAVAHKVVRHSGCEVDIRATAAAARDHSRLLILIRAGALPRPRVLEYVVDDGDPQAALQTGMELAEAALEAGARRHS